MGVRFTGGADSLDETLAVSTDGQASGNFCITLIVNVGVLNSVLGACSVTLNPLRFKARYTVACLSLAHNTV